MKRNVLLLALALKFVLSGGTYAQGAFTSIDIGSSAPAGQTIITNGGFDVSSATGDIWSGADDFRFVYRQVTGDFDIRTRIAGFNGIGYWAKAGLMVREDLTDSAANGFMIATRSAGWGRYMFTARLSKTFGTFVHSQGSFERVRYPNVWIRIVRVGNFVIQMHSTNGIAWTQIGINSMTQLPRTAFAGMAISNHPDAGTSRATAQFRDVTLDTGSPIAPVIFSQPVSQIVNPATDVTFSLTALGRGTLSYQWFRNGILIEGATNSTHELRSVQKSDEAKFTCLVRNEFGEVLSWAGLLEVEEPNSPFDGILLERYNRVYGRRVEYMINATNYPGAPVSAIQPTAFEVPSLVEDAGARLRGYVTAPQSGEYFFFIAADDRGELWLSPDENPANKAQIALCYYWVNFRQWDFYDSQVSDSVRLEAGKRYYLEALIKGEGGSNYGSVGWFLPDETFEGPIPARHFISPRPVVTLSGLADDGTLRLRIDGATNSLYELQSSTNLVDWSSILTNRPPIDYVAHDLTTNSLQFYRAVTAR